MVYIDSQEGHITEIKFEKCKEGLKLFRDFSIQSIVDEEKTELGPLSAESKSSEMSDLSDMIFSMASKRMDDQRCLLPKVL